MMTMNKYIMTITAALLVLMGCSKETQYRTVEVTLVNPTTEVNVAGDQPHEFLQEGFIGFKTDAEDRGAAKALFSLDGALTMSVSVNQEATSLWCYTKGAIGKVQTFTLPSQVYQSEVATLSDMIFCSKPVDIAGKTSVEVPVEGLTAAVLLNVFDSRGEYSSKTVSSIKIESADENNFIVGDLSLNFARPGISAINNGHNVVTISAVEGGEGLKVGTSDFPLQAGAVLIPCEFTGTITIVGDGFTAVKEINTPVSLTAGYVKTIDVDLAVSSMSKKLKVGVIGDSISSFSGIIPSGYKAYYPKSDCDVNTWQKTYWGKLITDYWNAELDVNCSWSGGCVAPGVSGKTVGSDFVSRCRDFVDPDVILLYGGTNDAIASNGVAQGDYDYDSPFASLNTHLRFRDSYIAVIKAIQVNYPDAQIIVILGDHVTGEFATSVVEIAAHYQLPLVDFRDDPTLAANKYSGSHPNATGMAYMAKKIYDETKDIVSKL